MAISETKINFFNKLHIWASEVANSLFHVYNVSLRVKFCYTS